METIMTLLYGGLISFATVIICVFIIPIPNKEKLEKEWEEEALKNGFKNWNV